MTESLPLSHVTESVPLSPALDERTLLAELNYRSKDEFASAINLVALAAVRADNVEVKTALSDVVDLLEEHANVLSSLTMPDCDVLIDATDHLAKLCFAVSRSRLDPMNIHLVFAADTFRLQSERCWRLGIAVHEMVTNAVRHAYFESREGEIRVELTGAAHSVNCTVSDTGSVSATPIPGRGLNLLAILAKDLGGQIEYSGGTDGSVFTLVFPLTEREQLVNRECGRPSSGQESQQRGKAAPPQPVINENLPLQTPHRQRPSPAAAV